jgi:hypothetical protein
MCPQEKAARDGNRHRDGNAPRCPYNDADRLRVGLRFGHDIENTRSSIT